MKANRSSPTFCPRAFHGYNQQINHVCCMIDTQEKYDNYDDLMSSELVKQIQEQFNRGERPDVCHKCWAAEDRGLQSHRMTAPPVLSEDAHDNQLVYLTLFTGNICNFACRTCHSVLSFQLQREEDWQRSEFGFGNRGKSRVYANYDEILKMDLGAVKTVSVLGGEPFLDLKHFDVIDRIFEQSDDNGCSIHYSTNGSTDIQSYYEKHLSQFREVKISFSIDAIGRAFEYVRTQGKWPMVHENIMNACRIHQEHDNFQMHFHVTISPLNLFALSELSNYMEIHNIAFKPQIVQYPEYYSFKVFPDEIKQHILDNYDFGVFNNVVKNAFDKTEFELEQLSLYVEMIRRTQLYRKMDFVEYIPDAGPVFEMMKNYVK